MDKDSIFKILSEVDCSKYTDKKGDLTYLSWADALAETLKRYPDLDFDVEKDKDNNNMPFFYDERAGIFCYTWVRIGEITRKMWLNVMDGSNRTMFFHPYNYTVYNKYKRCNEEKEVPAATAFDINKTIMRCLAKNLAAFGLGLYIYRGEDFPEVEDESNVQTDKKNDKKTVGPNTNPEPVKELQQQLNGVDETNWLQVCADILSFETLAEVKKYLKDNNLPDLKNVNPADADTAKLLADTRMKLNQKFAAKK